MKNSHHRWPDVSLVDLITEEGVPLRQKEAGNPDGNLAIVPNGLQHLDLLGVEIVHPEHVTMRFRQP